MNRNRETLVNRGVLVLLASCLIINSVGDHVQESVHINLMKDVDAASLRVKNNHAVAGTIHLVGYGKDQGVVNVLIGRNKVLDDQRWNAWSRDDPILCEAWHRF